MATAVGTPRARALSAALRKVRQEQGVSLRDLAGRLSMLPSQLSNLETGKRLPSVETTATILGALRVSATERERILSLARNAAEPNWLTVGIPGIPQQLAGAWECERAATDITAWHPCLVPGLLQTTDYARFILAADELPKADIESRVLVKIARREILTKSDPVRLKALVAESALREPIGTDDIMREQLRSLINLGGLANVEIRVVPSYCGWHPGVGGPFVLYEFSDAPAVVHFEHYSSGAFNQDEDDVKAYRGAIRKIGHRAMMPSDSIDLIAQMIVDRWSKNDEMLLGQV